MPRGLSVQFPSCGQCHDSFPNSRGTVKLEIQSPRSIQVGSKAPVTLKLSGGPQSKRGGFNLLSDRGSFIAGTNTKLANNGLEITHSSSLSRSWTFGFQATQTGLQQWTAVGNAVNGNGRNSGDSWGFYGLDSSSPGEPYRVYANDRTVLAFGSSCAGDKGYQALLGMPKAARLGASFTTELYDVPQGKVTLCLMGISRTRFGAALLPLDLGFLGMKSCSLYVSMDFHQAVVTSGQAGPGSGQAKVTWALPMIPALRGNKLYFQHMTLDSKANGLGISMSHALEARIQ